MNMKELQEFFANKPAEVSIDFIKGTESDCKLNVSVSINKEEFMKMGYDLPFEQAEGFIKDLQAELESVKQLANE